MRSRQRDNTPYNIHLCVFDCIILYFNITVAAERIVNNIIPRSTYV